MQHIAESISARFQGLVFDPHKHLYKVDGIPYPSVSALIKEHEPQVNFNFILPHSARKHNKTPEELRKEWDKKRDDACDLGHKTHDFAERFTGLQIPSNGHERAVVRFITELSSEYDILFREIRMFSRKYRYAGTEDLILISKRDGHIITADYKTNGDLFKSYRNTALLAPFTYLECNPYNKYQLQLSYYQIMLEEVGCLVKERWLVYLKEDSTYKIYKLENFTEELKEYMQPKIAKFAVW